MHALKARVHRGRLVMDEPTELPEGTEIELVAVDRGDGLDERLRAELHAQLDQGLQEADEDGVDAATLIAELRSRG